MRQLLSIFTLLFYLSGCGVGFGPSLTQPANSPQSPAPTPSPPPSPPSPPSTLNLATLDTSFSTDGVLLQPLGTGADYAFSLSLQVDGKFVLTGHCWNGANNDFCVTRFLTSGSLDSSFSSDGVLLQAIGTSSDRVHSSILQNDGKIVLGGQCSNGSNYDFCIARLLSNGSLDSSFSSDGVLLQAIGTNGDKGATVSLQSDGKIVMGGSCRSGGVYDFCMARLLSNGSLDSSFSSDGVLLQPIGTSNDKAYSLSLQSDRKTVLGGFCYNGVNNDFCVARFLTSGSLDSSFSSDGVLLQAIGTSSDRVHSSILQNDGKIVLVGHCSNGSNYDFCLVRLLSNGSLDSSFSTDGVILQSLGTGDDIARSLILQSNGIFVLGGYCSNGTNNDFCLMRLLSNGSLDTSLSTDGVLLQPIGTSNDINSSLSLQSDGKIVMGGDCWSGANYDFCLTRFGDFESP